MERLPLLPGYSFRDLTVGSVHIMNTYIILFTVKRNSGN